MSCHTGNIKLGDVDEIHTITRENGIKIYWFSTKLRTKISWLLFMAHSVENIGSHIDMQIHDLWNWF